MDLPRITFRFVADGVSLSALPLQRVAEYLTEVGSLLGSTERVHLAALEEGSLVAVAAAEAAVAPRVRDRLTEARRGEAGTALAARQRLDGMLADDNATGNLREERPGGIVVEFPGIRARVADMPAFWQPGELRGQLVRLYGEDETKHGRIRSAGETRLFECREELARRLRHHLWDYVRLTGRGRWRRTGDGAWLLLDFQAASFGLLRDDELATIVSGIRQRGGLGIGEEAMLELATMREE